MQQKEDTIVKEEKEEIQLEVGKKLESSQFTFLLCNSRD